MQRENDIFGSNEGTTLEEPMTNPTDMPSIGVAPGYKTSEGQLTFVFVAAAFVMSWVFKREVNPDQVQGFYGAAMAIIEQIGPIVAAGGVLWNYITSRGKTKSNAIHATAAVALKGDFLGSLLGGKGWKDPERYIGIGKIAAEAGIIPGPAGKIVGKVLGGDEGSESGFTVDDCVEGIQRLDTRVKKLEAK